MPSRDRRNRDCEPQERVNGGQARSDQQRRAGAADRVRIESAVGIEPKIRGAFRPSIAARQDQDVSRKRPTALGGYCELRAAASYIGGMSAAMRNEDVGPRGYCRPKALLDVASEQATGEKGSCGLRRLLPDASPDALILGPEGKVRRAAPSEPKLACPNIEQVERLGAPIGQSSADPLVRLYDREGEALRDAMQKVDSGYRSREAPSDNDYVHA